MRRSQRWGGVLAGLLVLGLAACAPDPVPTEAPIAEPTATPTPTPTVEPVGDPESILPLGCADLLTLDYVQARVRGETVSVSVDESSATAGYESFAVAGGLRCVWGGEGRTDGGYDIGLQLNIVSGGARDFEKWLAQQDYPFTWDADRYGDRSATHCDENNQNGCYGGVVVDGYWIDFSLRDATPRSQADAQKRLDQLLEPVVDGIRSAGPPREQWQPPTDAYDGADLCADGIIASAAVGGKVTVTPDTPPAEVYYSAVGTGGDRALVTRCTWNSKVPERQTIGVAVYPAGSWLFDRFVAEPAEAAPGYLSDAKPVDVPGSDGALVATADAVWSAMSIRGSLVILFDTTTYDAPNLIPVMKSVAQQIGE